MSDLGNKNIFAKNLKYYMEINKIDRNQLCTALNFKYTTVSEWLAGNKYPRIDKIEILANYFGIQKSDLIEDKSLKNEEHIYYNNIIPMPKTKRIPLLGTIACGEPILAVENIECNVSVPEDIKADFALRCEGDSMIDANIFDGDIVYIKEQPIVENGQIAAVLIGEDATLKRFYQEDDTVTLMPCNTALKPLVYSGQQLENIRILGKAVYYLSRVK